MTSSEVTTSTSAVASKAGTGSLGQPPPWTIDGMLIGAVWVVFGPVGARIGAAEGMEAAGFWWGLLLGPVGLVVVAFGV
jgi:hypothetical protein